jgi:hypothetical protein
MKCNLKHQIYNELYQCYMKIFKTKYFVIILLK